jgi:hypothetical protein
MTSYSKQEGDFILSEMTYAFSVREVFFVLRLKRSKVKKS